MTTQMVDSLFAFVHGYQGYFLKKGKGYQAVPDTPAPEGLAAMCGVTIMVLHQKACRVMYTALWQGHFCTAFCAAVPEGAGPEL